MAKRWYTKEATYILPAWRPLAVHIDGLYIDGYLFDQNIPVLDNTVWISVKPRTSPAFIHSINFSVPQYINGKVNFLYKEFTWWLGQSHAQSDKIFCNGHPYGMGINLFGVACYIAGIIASDIVYDVSFIMEVDI